MAWTFCKTGATLEEQWTELADLSKLTGKGKPYGVLSAHGWESPAENLAAHGRLVSLLQKKGYDPVPVRGTWHGVPETAVVVPELHFDDLLELGDLFKQEAVMFKGTDGVLGLYELREHAVAFTVNGKGALATDPKVADGVLWGPAVPWDGRTPVVKAVAEQLHEQTRIEPR